MGEIETKTLYEGKIARVLRNKTTIKGFLGYFHTKTDSLLW